MTKQNNAKWCGKTTTTVFGAQQLPEIRLMPVVAECLRLEGYAADYHAIQPAISMLNIGTIQTNKEDGVLEF